MTTPKPGILARWFPRHFRRVSRDDVLAVVQAEQYMTGTEVVDAIKVRFGMADWWRQTSGGSIVYTVYFLHDMEEAGLLESKKVSTPRGYQVKAYRLKGSKPWSK